MSEPAHYLWSASGMARNLACPGSIQFLNENPLPETSYSKAGTETHEVAQQLLSDVDPFSIDCEVEVLEQAQGYVDTIRALSKSIFDTFGREPTVVIERKISFDVAGHKVGGTPDCLIFLDGEILIVFDGKFGYEYVDPRDNDQLMTYTFAAIEAYELDIVRVEHHIYQVQNGVPSHKDYVVPAKKMEAFWDVLQKAVSTQSPKRCPGSHCKYCNKSLCDAFQESIGETTIVQTASKDISLKDFSVERLLKIDEMGPLIVKMVKEASAILHQKASSGIEIPGRKLVKAYGNRSWIDDKAFEQMKSAMDLHETQYYYPPECKKRSPSQIEGAIKKTFKGKTLKDIRDKKLSQLSSYVNKLETGTKLVPADAPGDPVSIGFTDEDDILPT